MVRPVIALLIILVLLAVIWRVTRFVFTADDRELVRDEAMEAEIEALHTVQHLSALAWTTRQAMYQAAAQRRHFDK